jgi:hypothetical protein
MVAVGGMTNYTRGWRSGRLGLRHGARSAMTRRKRARQKSSRQGVIVYVAPDAIVGLAIVTDQDDVTLLVHHLGNGVPWQGDRFGAAHENRARARQDQSSGGLRGLVRHRRRRAEMTRVVSDNAMAGLDDRELGGRNRRAKSCQMLETREHLTFDLDVLVREA